jgi:putative ABC transport system permease protein
VAFYDRLLPELSRLPGVEGAAIVGPLPLTGSRYTISFELPGNRAHDAARRLNAGFAFVSPGYFRAMRIPVKQGREFTTADTETSPRTVVINESFARQYFPGENPLGKRIKPGLSTTEPETPWREVVGVVSDVKQQTLNEAPSPAYFVPHAQGLITTPHIVVRAAGALDAIPETVRRVVAATDPELAIYDVRTLQDRLSNSMASQRFTTFLLTLFAGLGLLLTAIGLYGVLAYGVTQRTHEFGVRVALGARPRAIVAIVVGGALSLVGSGLLLGVVAAIALARIMMAILDFVQPPTYRRTPLSRSCSSARLSARPFPRRVAPCESTRCRRCDRADGDPLNVGGEPYQRSPVGTKYTNGQAAGRVETRCTTKLSTIYSVTCTA